MPIILITLCCPLNSQLDKHVPTEVPWPHSMASLHGLTPWPHSMASLHGLTPWPHSMASLHGLTPWPHSMASLRGLMPHKASFVVKASSFPVTHSRKAANRMKPLSYVLAMNQLDFPIFSYSELCGVTTN